MTTAVQRIEESVREAGQEHAFADHPALAAAARFGVLLARAGMVFDWIEIAQAALKDGDEATARRALDRAKSILLGEHALPRRAAVRQAAE